MPELVLVIKMLGTEDVGLGSDEVAADPGLSGDDGKIQSEAQANRLPNSYS